MVSHFSRTGSWEDAAIRRRTLQVGQVLVPSCSLLVGVRKLQNFGLSPVGADDLQADRKSELYQPETLRRIRTGEGISPEDAAQCKRELQEARKQIASVFNDVDLLVTPTAPIPAPAIAELKANPDQLRPRELVLLRNTRPMNVWGLPAISVPCGFTQFGLPIGLQIIGPHGGESEVLQLAHAYEQATAWHQHLPNL